MTSQSIPAVEGVWLISDAKGMDLSDYDEIMFQFDQGKLYGNSPCRSFNSEYRLDDDKLQILRPEVFGSLCSEKAMDAESAFFKLLTKTQSAKIDGNGGLVLESSGEVIMQGARKDA